jgi:Flp pilus assembly pilin Flp
MPSLLRRLLRNERAATLIEYALIVCLIATAAVGAFTNVGNGVQNVMITAANAMN